MIRGEVEVKRTLAMDTPCPKYDLTFMKGALDYILLESSQSMLTELELDRDDRMVLKIFTHS